MLVLPDDPVAAIPNYPESEEILRAAGFQIQRCTESEENFDCFPWAGVNRARVVAPFVVDVRWGFVATPLSSHGTRTRYVTLFGARVSGPRHRWLGEVIALMTRVLLIAVLAMSLPGR